MPGSGDAWKSHEDTSSEASARTATRTRRLRPGRTGRPCALLTCPQFAQPASRGTTSQRRESTHARNRAEPLARAVPRVASCPTVVARCRATSPYESCATTRARPSTGRRTRSAAGARRVGAAAARAQRIGPGRRGAARRTRRGAAGYCRRAAFAELVAIARRAGRRPKVQDAWIAATARAVGVPVYTRPRLRRPVGGRRPRLTSSPRRRRVATSSRPEPRLPSNRAEPPASLGLRRPPLIHPATCCTSCESRTCC